jgi:branched-chain amino acid transport system permease protein
MNRTTTGSANLKIERSGEADFEKLGSAARDRLNFARAIRQKQRGWLGFSTPSWVILAATVILVILPVIGLPITNQRLIANVVLFAAFALSYDLLFGFTGIFSFGHALFFGIGAYSVGICALNYGLPMWLGAAVGVIICGLLGILTGFVSLRVQGVFFAMVTLALASTAHSLSSKMVDFTKGDEGLSLIKAKDAPDTTTVYFLAIVLGVVAYFGLRVLVNSPLGRVLVAIRENERRADMIGYNVLSYKLVALTISAVIASLAGTLYALRNGIVNPTVFSGDISLLPLLMVILGGAGTLYGAIIGAVIIQCLNYILSSREFVESVKDWFILGPILEHWLLLLGLIYVLIVLFLPYGIVGTWRLYQPKIKKLFSKERN